MIYKLQGQTQQKVSPKIGILHWLFKRAYEQETDCNTSNSPSQRKAINNKKARGKDIVLHKHNHKAYQGTKRTEGRRKHGCNNLKVFKFICGKDIPKLCFYRTLNLNRLGNLSRRKDFVNSMKMKREELSKGVVGISKKENSAAHVGKKVLPITEASLTTSTERSDQCNYKETNDEQSKGSKKKTISRMKELLRWAASAKTEKKGKFNGQKVLQFRKHGTIKAVPSDDEDHQLRSESPKISLTWDLESNCSTISSVYSSSSVISTASLFRNEQAKIAHSPPIRKILPQQNGHITCRTGNWITTDSEFVVLEL